MRGVYYRTEKDGTPLQTPELRISATKSRTVYYDTAAARDAALQAGEIKEGSIVLTGYTDGESEVLMKENVDWANKVNLTAVQLATGYVAPADGIVCISGTSPDNSVRGFVTVNNIQISSSIAGASVGYRECQVQIPVNEGDIVKTVDGNGNAQTWILHATPIYIPFKTVAEPLTLPVNVVINPSLLDWGRAVSLTAAQVQAGYTAPSNGMLVGTLTTSNTSSGNCKFDINGVWVSGTISIADRAVTLNIPVSEGDRLTYIGVDGWASNLTSHISFVPFKS